MTKVTIGLFINAFAGHAGMGVFPTWTTTRSRCPIGSKSWTSLLFLSSREFLIFNLRNGDGCADHP